MTFKIIALSVFALLWSAYFVIRLRESGIRPLRFVLDGLGRIRPVTRLLVLLTVGHLTFFAGGKHGGTNDVQGGGAPLMMRPPARTAVPVPNFTLASVGTDETFDFTPSETAAVATNWLLHGASTQPLRLSFDDWVFPFGEKGYSNFTVFASGEVMPGEVNTNRFLVPFGTSLGIAPVANWNMMPANESSCFWSGFSPSNTLLLTWQNALLGREATNPVSFQAELKPSGGFTFRYDLSRLASEELLTNVTVGVCDGRAGSPYPPQSIQNEGSFVCDCGAAGVRALPGRTLSSLSFVSHDEQLCEENREDFDARIGDEDPYAYPEGSTNTVLEHVFYSGTTNGPFAYPQSTDGNAVLMVSVSGHGSGELMVGSKFVPLVGRPAPVSAPRLFAAPLPSPSMLAVTVPRGSTQRVYMRGDSTLLVSFDSDDFAFGEMPDLSGRHFGGWINFPFVNATVPCIHDYNARKKLVSLQRGDGADELTCEWQGTSQIEVENIHPVSAMLTGHFSGRTTTPVTYTLSHPNYLFGQATYSQTARYCPRPPEEDDDDPDHPHGGGGYYDGEDESDPWDDDEDPWYYIDPDESLPPDPEPEDYDEASTNYPHMSDVLKIRDPLEYTNPIRLTVPTGHRNCCPCPDHATNWVGVVYQSPRVKVVDAVTEQDFTRSGESLDVKIAGVAPSSAVGDAAVSFAANGEVCLECAYTVLGVGIDGGYVPNFGNADLKMLNQRKATFGLPILVNTNLSVAAELELVTNVRLPSGNIHLGFEDSTAPFEAWIYDYRTSEYLKLASSTDGALDISFAGWRQLVGGSSDSYSPTTWIYITAADAGKATLVYRYWDVSGSAIVEDEARQVISSIDPPLMADVNRDGEIDGLDGMRQIAQNPFRFWYNSDVVKGDCLGQVSDSSPNADDLKVNGKFDLVNLFPLQVDVTRFQEAWGRAATFRLRARTQDLRFCVLGEDISAHVAQMQTRTVQTVGGECLERASLTPLDYAGTNLVDVLPSGAYSAVLAFEAKDQVHEWESPELVVSLDDREVFTYRIPLSITSVDEMYRYLNLRGAESDPQFVPMIPNSPWNCPDAETDSKHFVFVHGYDVDATQSRNWARVMFKRLWWAGSRSKFTAVDWYGDDSRIYVPVVGEVSPNYYVNVEHAFMTAEALKDACAQLPGEKIMLAHSLGNMLVSAAVRDYNLQYEKYYMLNAAVPMEAYDEDSRSDLMVDGAWENLDERFRVSHFSDLFIGQRFDFRIELSWKGRFAGIRNAVNCYSTTEDILKNPSVIKVFGAAVGETTGGIWSKQELFKGCTLWYGVNSITFAGTHIEGGWGVNADHVANLFAYIPLVGFNASYFANYTREDLIARPLFTAFNDSRMTSTNALNIVDYGLKAKMLGDAIPAESFAAGANAVDGVDSNYDFQSQIVLDWPKKSGDENVWEHSDIKNVSYYFTHAIFEKIKNRE